MRTPSTLMLPVVGASRPAIRPSSVDLPDPDGPVIATTRPRAIVNVVGWRIVSGPAPLVTVRETLESSIIPGATSLPDAVDEHPQLGIHDSSYDLRPLDVRMDAVRLVQRGIAGDPLEQERQERDAAGVLAQQVHVDLTEGVPVVLAIVRRRFHPAEQDLNVLAQRLLDDLREVLLRLLRGQSAQRVVAAKREDEDVRAAQHLARPAQAAGRGIAGHAGVD